MRRCRGSNGHTIERVRVTRLEGNGVLVSLSAEPLGHRGRREQRNIRWQCIQRVEGKMIRVSMRQHYRVELRQRIQRNSGSTYTRQKFTESWIKIGIGEKSLPADLN
jgi:hypothetical protein